MTSDISGCKYDHPGLGHSHEYLLPSVFRSLENGRHQGKGKRIFDLGCGNGSVGHAFTTQGWDVTGVDPSEEGIEQARRNYPWLHLNSGSAYDDLATRHGQFLRLLASRSLSTCIFHVICGNSFLFSRARRNSDFFNSLSRLLEEPRSSSIWKSRQALYGYLGLWPHQILVI